MEGGREERATRRAGVRWDGEPGTHEIAVAGPSTVGYDEPGNGDAMTQEHENESRF